ncbi:MAG: hypothetical protein ACRCTE_07265 [Cellulosilyticaceae bacterium]
MKVVKKIGSLLLAGLMVMGVVVNTNAATPQTDYQTTSTAKGTIADTGTFYGTFGCKQTIDFYYETGICYPRQELEIKTHPALFSYDISHTVDTYKKGEYVYYDRVYPVNIYDEKTGEYNCTIYMISWISYSGNRRYMGVSRYTPEGGLVRFADCK